MLENAFRICQSTKMHLKNAHRSTKFFFYFFHSPAPCFWLQFAIRQVQICFFLTEKNPLKYHYEMKFCFKLLYLACIPFIQKKMNRYVLVLGLYSKILDSKKLDDFYMVEYSLEVTLKEKLQTRLDSNSKAELRVMPGLLVHF